MSLTPQQQDEAARRQLRERGVSEERIAYLDTQAEAWTGEAEKVTPLPATIYLGWCEEHKRYFTWPIGCTPTNVPTSAQVREYYRRIKSSRAPFTDNTGQQQGPQ